MPYERRDNSGLLADNDRKEKDSHPDMSGSVTINGTEMWISGWWKDGRRGRFLSLAFKPKEDRMERRGDHYVAPKKRPLPPVGEEIDDDLPF